MKNLAILGLTFLTRTMLAGMLALALVYVVLPMHSYAIVGPDLKIDNQSWYNGQPSLTTSWVLTNITTQKFWDFESFKPSDWIEDTISLHVANSNAWACMNVTLVSNDDISSTAEELNDGDEAEDQQNLFDGELAQSINSFLWADDGDNVLEEGENIFWEGALSELNNTPLSLADGLQNVWTGEASPLLGGTTYYVGKALCLGVLAKTPLPAGTGVNPGVATGFVCDGDILNNVTQSDALTADISFTAYQPQDDADFTCQASSEGGFSDTETSTGNILATEFIEVDFPTITVIKQVINNDGGTASVSDFQLFVDNGTTITNVVSGVATPVSAGTYTVGEILLSGYVATSLSGDCNEEGTLTLNADDNKTCVITNDDIPIDNEPPVASFTFQPNSPEVGDTITFDASNSYDPDGVIVIYGWDWESDGITDVYTSTPVISFDGFAAGVSTTTLRVTDDKRAIGLYSQAIFVEQVKQDTGTASVVGAFCNSFEWFCSGAIREDGKNIEKIDEWIRDRDGDNQTGLDGTAFDWLRGTKCGGSGSNLKQKECLISALNTEFLEGTGLTHKAYVLSLITEQEMVENAFTQQQLNTYKLYLNALIDWLPFKNVIDAIFNDYTTAGIEGFLVAASPQFSELFTYGTPMLSLGMSAVKLDETFSEIDDGLYHEALAVYFLLRGTGSDHDSAWKSPSDDGTFRGPGVILAGILSDDMLAETEIKFDEWYNRYQPHFEGALGFNKDFKLSLKKDIEAQIKGAIQNAAR